MNNSKCRHSFLPLLPLALLLTSTSFAAAERVAVTGTSVTPETVPYWNVTGTWSPNGGELLLVDALRAEILRYAANGDFLGFLKPPAELEEAYRPKAIQATPSGYFLEYATGKFAELDQGFGLVKKYSILEESRRSGAQVSGIFQWTLTDGAMVAFADIVEGGQPSGALVRIGLSSPGDFSVLERIPIEDPRRQMFLMGLPYVASVDGRAYYGLLGEAAALKEVDPQVPVIAHLARAPELMKTAMGLPDIPEDRGPGGAIELFSSLTRKPLVSGLYGWRGNLFVAVRRPSKADLLEWSLVMIEPETGAHKVFFLPEVHDPHLTFVPGPEGWAVVRKGPVEALGQQKVRALYLVDGAEFKRRQ